jgi:hypothetical protein
MVVEDASTGAFLNALRCFTALRGSPRTIYSDNGTNFVGAGRELKPVMERLSEDKDFQEELVQRGITWQRYPPLAPHWGGVHYALIRSAKSAMRHVLEIGEKMRLLRDYELATLYSEVTGFSNNRPLTYTSNDPADGYLTPNNFLLL